MHCICFPVLCGIAYFPTLQTKYWIVSQQRWFLQLYLYLSTLSRLITCIFAAVLATIYSCDHHDDSVADFCCAVDPGVKDVPCLYFSLWCSFVVRDVLGHLLWLKGSSVVQTFVPVVHLQDLDAVYYIAKPCILIPKWFGMAFSHNNSNGSAGHCIWNFFCPHRLQGLFAFYICVSRKQGCCGQLDTGTNRHIVLHNLESLNLGCG